MDKLGEAAAKTATLASRLTYGGACKCCKAAKVKCTGEVCDERDMAAPFYFATTHMLLQRPCPRCVRLSEVCIDAPSRRALKAAKHSSTSSPAAASCGDNCSSNCSPQCTESDSDQRSSHTPGSATGSEVIELTQRDQQLIRHDHSSGGGGGTAPSDSGSDSFSLAELLLALAGSKEVRFNTGSFLLDSHNAHLPHKLLARMQAVVQASGHVGSAGVLAAMRNVGRGVRGASLPLRLLHAVAPRAHGDFMRGMIAQGAMGLHIAQGLAWDGLHLGIVGIAAALLAWNKEEDEVIVPDGFFVISSPHGCVATSKEGGGFHAPRMRSDLQNVVGGSHVAVSLLLERWPHLARIFASATAANEQAASAFLRALVASTQSGETVTVPPLVYALHKQHIKALPEAAACNIFVAGRLSGCMYGSDSFADLVGVKAWMSALPELVGSGQDEEGTPRWMHPCSLLRRCLAFISARQMGLHSFQYEGKYVRAVGLRDSPDSDRPPTVLDDMLYSAYYGVESIFEERTPHGQVLACSSYMSDIVFEREPIVLNAESALSAELDVIEQLILPTLQNLPLEVQLACRKAGIMPLTAFRDSILDPELEKIRLRCLLLLISGQLPPQEAVSSDGASSRPEMCCADDLDVGAAEGRESLDGRVRRVADALVQQNDQPSMQRVKEDMIISLGGTGIHEAMELHCGSEPVFFALPTAHGRKLIAQISGVGPAGAASAHEASAAHSTVLSCVPFF